MSVILEDSDGVIWLYCKGADSSVFPLIEHGNIEEAKAHVADFSMVRFKFVFADNAFLENFRIC
jgi:magnesium-transporting ATPase (P-type)